MKRRLCILLLAVICLAAFPISAFAATVDVQNYFYAHENTAGTFAFKDKNGLTIEYGDAIQHDASIKYVIIEAQGMAAGDTIEVTEDTGAKYTATSGTQLTLNANDYISINLIKTGTNEVLAKLTEMKTFDLSDAGTDVYYYFTNYGTPTAYGSLGPGSGGGGTPATVTGNHYYFPPRDSYKYDYTSPSGVSHYELHFTAPNGTPYVKDYPQAPTGVHYLTCNGTYEMQFFDAAGVMVAKSPSMTTTAIISPTCDSPAGTGYTDMIVRPTPTGIEWDPVTGAVDYDVYKDGIKVGTTPGTSMDVPAGGGPVTVVAKDATGAPIAQTDLTPTTPPPTDPPPSTGCDGCKFLTDMLACPGWSQYMGDLTDAFRNALPPPPNWDDIANKIGKATIDQLKDYVGNVPEVPTPDQIKNDTNQPLPSVDNSVPGADQLTPSVPPDFNTPKPFDITTGPQIDITDESKPFTISDPLSGMQIDSPGTPVIPGDPRNDSGGIKTPDNPDTGGPATPAPPPSSPPPVPSGDPGNVPPSDMPTPSDPGGPGPIPAVPSSEIPIPTIVP